MKDKTEKPNQTTDCRDTVDVRVISSLIYGRYYIQLPNKRGIKQSENPLKYCGIQMYKGEVQYNFWDDKTKLYHWCDPEKMVEV